MIRSNLLSIHPRRRSAMITSYSAKFWYDSDPNFTIELNIPSEINGHTVTAIGDGALRESATKISGITLPPTIKEIGNRAIDCRYLKYLKLNDGLEVIKDYAINCGDILETLVIPESVKYIGNRSHQRRSVKKHHHAAKPRIYRRKNLFRFGL